MVAPHRTFSSSNFPARPYFYLNKVCIPNKLILYVPRKPTFFRLYQFSSPY